MKKIFGKLKDFIAKYKGIGVIIILAGILFIILLIILISCLIGGSSSKYGDRLDGIEDVEISDKTYSKLEKKIEDNDEVKEFDYRLEGRIVYLDITFSNDCTLDKAKEIANSSLEVFAKDEIAYYDFEFVMNQEKEDGFAVTGTKHPNIETIGWVKS